MARIHSALTDLFTDIADAIRSKTGSNEVLIADGFPSTIRGIPTGNTDIEDSIITKQFSGSYTNARVSVVGYGAFAKCSALSAVNFPACITIGAAAFSECINLLVVSFPVCTEIGGNAFNRCTGLTIASFPECSIIGNYAFSYCTSIVTISFPLCTSIGNGAFSSCNNLAAVNFPVCSIVENYAFASCMNLATASFQACEIIGSSTFYDCRKLMSLYLLGSSVPKLSNSAAFKNTPMSNSSYTGTFGSIIVAESMIDAFKIATNWSRYASRFSAYNGTD